MLALFLAGLLFPGERPITKADSVGAIYVEDAGLASTGTKLVLAAWADGHAVWSGKEEQCGPPYLAGKAEPGRLSAFLSRAAADGIFRDESLSQVHFGPDSKFTAIFLKSGTRQLLLRSWHELYERGGRVVAKAGGLTPLEGSDRLAVLRREPPEYLYYRMVWSELRSRAFSLLPPNGRPVTGAVAVVGGVLSWRESAGASLGAGSPNTEMHLTRSAPGQLERGPRR